MRIRVECRAEEPCRFVLGERAIEVEDLLDRWYGADADHFRVRDADGHCWVLKHLRAELRWELTSFTRRGSRGTAVAEPESRVLH